MFLCEAAMQPSLKIATQIHSDQKNNLLFHFISPLPLNWLYDARVYIYVESYSWPSRCLMLLCDVKNIATDVAARGI